MRREQSDLILVRQRELISQRCLPLCCAEKDLKSDLPTLSASLNEGDRTFPRQDSPSPQLVSSFAFLTWSSAWRRLNKRRHARKVQEVSEPIACASILSRVHVMSSTSVRLGSHGPARLKRHVTRNRI